MALSTPKYIVLPFAVSGNRQAVPDATQSDGSLSWNQGYGPFYEEDPDTAPTALDIERQQMNQFLFDLSAAVQLYQQGNAPNWITTDDNGGTPYSYPQWAVVNYSGTPYVSLVANNTAVPGTDATKWRNNTVSPSAVPTGTVLDFAGGTVPDGFLICDGSAVSRTGQSALFSAIGTNWGIGDGSTTFNVPDLRGAVTAGRDNMGGTPAGKLTSTSGMTGTQLGFTGGDQRMQTHTHGVTDPGHIHNTTFGQALPNSGGVNGLTPFTGTVINTSNSQTGITIQNTGAGSSQNVQPTAIVNKIIKT